MIKIERLVVGWSQTNCYLISNGRSGILIDPGDEPEFILSTIQNQNLDIRFIVNTHGHIDHIGANDEIAKSTNARVLIHPDDAKFLTDPDLNLSKPFFGEGRVFKEPDGFLKEDEVVEVGSIKLKVLSTPGHTPGSVSLILEDKIFCGDTVFSSGVGRTDLPGGDSKRLMYSVKKLCRFSDDTILYPGHNCQTTIEKARWFIS
jgi:glyoxylase-like metal-dependent hydrolase (beta-lactamase superfamily II)